MKIETGNILLAEPSKSDSTSQYNLKLADFGLARELGNFVFCNFSNLNLKKYASLFQKEHTKQKTKTAVGTARCEKILVIINVRDKIMIKFYLFCFL